ncbi:MAG: SURF1 family protein, partial [Comamonas sp.]
DLGNLKYQAVRAEGQWLAGKTVLAQAATELGSGFWVLTPLQLDQGGQVLVNRGFIPDSQRAAWSDAAYAASHTPAGPVGVTGLLRLSEPHGGFLRSNEPAQQRWFSRDVAAIAQAGGLDAAAPFFIDAGIPSKAAALPGAAASDQPRPGMTVVRFHNNHLVYALTWYGLAAMVVGAAWLVARHGRKKR